MHDPCTALVWQGGVGLTLVPWHRYKRIGVIGAMSLVRRYSALYLTPETPMPQDRFRQVRAHRL